MNNVIINSRCYISPTGRIYYECLEAKAQYSSEHYASYPFTAVHTSHGGIPLTPYRNNCTPFTEWVVRDRRNMMFADSTRLKPVKINKNTRALHSKMPKGIPLDHVSYWCSSRCTLFMMIEPYSGYQQIMALNTLGYAVIEVPESLAPYSGGWSRTLGTPPRTKSFLITEAKHAQELDMIHMQLMVADLTAPVWNDTTGITVRRVR